MYSVEDYDICNRKTMYHLLHNQLWLLPFFSFTIYKLSEIHHKSLSLQVRFSGKDTHPECTKSYFMFKVTKAKTNNPLRVRVSYRNEYTTVQSLCVFIFIFQ